MKLKHLFIIIFFITAVSLGLWLFGTVSKFLPVTVPARPGDEKLLETTIYERDEKIQSETDALLHLFDRMPAVPVYLTAAPIIKTGSNTERGVGFTTCDRPESPVIYLKKEFYLKANRKQRVNILKHELTHAYLCRKGQMSGHDEQFRRKFAEVGGFGN